MSSESWGWVMRELTKKRPGVVVVVVVVDILFFFSFSGSRDQEDKEERGVEYFSFLVVVLSVYRMIMMKFSDSQLFFEYVF